MVALPLLLNHDPLPLVEVKVIVLPAHTLSGPLIIPASGNGSIVMTPVATAVPHKFVTV